MTPVVKETAELDNSIPKMLCQMDNHLGKYIFLLSHLCFLLLEIYSKIICHCYVLFPSDCDLEFIVIVRYSVPNHVVIYIST